MPGSGQVERSQQDTPQIGFSPSRDTQPALPSLLVPGDNAVTRAEGITRPACPLPLSPRHFPASHFALTAATAITARRAGIAVAETSRRDGTLRRHVRDARAAGSRPLLSAANPVRKNVIMDFLGGCAPSPIRQGRPASAESAEAGRGNLKPVEPRSIFWPGGMCVCPAGNGKGACA